ncbi:MAG: S-layer homology domain-containing protein [Melioribacteraceae bacterium]|nr:S-layer homology domain-containing protein [Melioribacteraceae bacterium]
MKIRLFTIVFLLIFSSLSYEAEAAKKFKDIPEKYWAYDAIAELTDKNVISGYTDGSFKPGAAVTRAQSAMFIVRALKLSTANRPNPKFSDVSIATSGYAEIATLVDIGVIPKASKFYPSIPATRSQVAQMLVPAFKLKGASTIGFTDVPKTHEAYTQISTLVAENITTGTSKTTFSPNANVTRVQMAVFIKRVLDLNEKEVIVKPIPPVTPPVVSDLPPVPVVSAENQAIMKEILVLLNKERAKVNAPPLKVHSGVQGLALIKAKDLADYNYFAHVSPRYGDYGDMLDKVGIKNRGAAENLTAGYSTAEMAVQAWMDSPGHKSNLLTREYTHVGVGSYSGGEYGIYHVTIFITQP